MGVLGICDQKVGSHGGPESMTCRRSTAGGQCLYAEVGSSGIGGAVFRSKQEPCASDAGLRGERGWLPSVSAHQKGEKSVGCVLVWVNSRDLVLCSALLQVGLRVWVLEFPGIFWLLKYLLRQGKGSCHWT